VTAKNRECAMLQRLLARWRLWEEALAGLDDPHGEYLLDLNERVRRLEAKVEQLRRPLSADAAAVARTRDPETE
jgi:hypothetical protein